MQRELLESYLAGWAMTCCATPESIEAMVAGAHPDIRFNDVNSANVHEGHEGIRRICALGTGKYADVEVTWGDLLCDGANWSIRWTFAARAPDGTHFSARGASAGRLADDGRVIEQTDYWSRSTAFTQHGVSA